VGKQQNISILLPEVPSWTEWPADHPWKHESSGKNSPSQRKRLWLGVVPRLQFFPSPRERNKKTAEAICAKKSARRGTPPRRMSARQLHAARHPTRSHRQEWFDEIGEWAADALRPPPLVVAREDVTGSHTVWVPPPPPGSRRGWVRDLTREGVEPNPGPGVFVECAQVSTCRSKTHYTWSRGGKVGAGGQRNAATAAKNPEAVQNQAAGAKRKSEAASFVLCRDGDGNPSPLPCLDCGGRHAHRDRGGRAERLPKHVTVRDALLILNRGEEECLTDREYDAVIPDGHCWRYALTGVCRFADDCRFGVHELLPAGEVAAIFDRLEASSVPRHALLRNRLRQAQSAAASAPHPRPAATSVAGSCSSKDTPAPAVTPSSEVVPRTNNALAAAPGPSSAGVARPATGDRPPRIVSKQLVHLQARIRRPAPLQVSGPTAPSPASPLGNRAPLTAPAGPDRGNQDVAPRSTPALAVIPSTVEVTTLGHTAEKKVDAVPPPPGPSCDDDEEKEEEEEAVAAALAQPRISDAGAPLGLELLFPPDAPPREYPVVPAPRAPPLHRPPAYRPALTPVAARLQWALGSWLAPRYPDGWATLEGAWYKIPVPMPMRDEAKRPLSCHECASAASRTCLVCGTRVCGYHVSQWQKKLCRPCGTGLAAWSKARGHEFAERKTTTLSATITLNGKEETVTLSTAAVPRRIPAKWVERQREMRDKALAELEGPSADVVPIFMQHAVITVDADYFRTALQVFFDVVSRHVVPRVEYAEVPGGPLRRRVEPTTRQYYLPFFSARARWERAPDPALLNYLQQLGYTHADYRRVDVAHAAEIMQNQEASWFRAGATQIGANTSLPESVDGLSHRLRARMDETLRENTVLFVTNLIAFRTVDRVSVVPAGGPVFRGEPTQSRGVSGSGSQKSAELSVC